jgi:hypothetical protein
MPYCFCISQCLTLVFSPLFFLNSEKPPNEPGDENNNDATQSGLTEADFDSNWDEAIETFDGMDLPEALLRGIYSYGFEKPSAIQQRAIKPTMLGRDLIAQAQSGTVGFLKELRRFSVICCVHARSREGRTLK